jgi:ribosomal protein S27AE
MSTRDLTDIHLNCTSCGDGFVFSAGEQELYRLRGVTLQPQQCPSCSRGGAVANPPQRSAADR